MDTQTTVQQPDMTVAELAGHMNDYATHIEGEIGVLKSDVSVLKGDVSSLKKDVSSLKKDVSSLKKDVSSLKETVSTMDARLINVEQTMLTKDEFHQTIKNISDDLYTMLDRILVSTETQRTEQAAEQAKYGRYDEQLENHQGRLVTIEQHLRIT
ncbi:MAG: hypothetical protein HYV32_00150 [Candidatus Kerfeldbacteria bacterium]|nr:hypothetical protein [Candidatus Kerfeldbacteria bacterium]